ncbi:MAG: hypothetical protein ACRDJJ_08555 [Actinomycetota bacterium]
MAAATLVVLMLVLVSAIGTAQERVVSRLRASPAFVKRWGGWILVLVGGWFLALAMWADFFAQVFPV